MARLSKCPWILLLLVHNERSRKSKQIVRDKREAKLFHVHTPIPFGILSLFSRGSAVCVSHPPQTLVFHLSRRTGLLTAQGIGVLSRKRFVASVLGRRQREYLVTYVRQLAGGIKENFCSKVCFLRAVPWLDWKSIVDRGKVKVGASFLFFVSPFFLLLQRARAHGPFRRRVDRDFSRWFSPFS